MEWIWTDHRFLKRQVQLFERERSYKCDLNGKCTDSEKERFRLNALGECHMGPTVLCTEKWLYKTLVWD